MVFYKKEPMVAEIRHKNVSLGTKEEHLGLGGDRYSVALFYSPNRDAVISCRETCQGPERPRKYPPVNAEPLPRHLLILNCAELFTYPSTFSSVR